MALPAQRVLPRAPSLNKKALQQKKDHGAAIVSIVTAKGSNGLGKSMEAQAGTASHHAEKWSPPSDAGEIVKRIHAMLHPRNIVLVGATDKPGNYAERIWNNLIKY